MAMRLYDLAKELNIPSAELLSMAGKAGLTVKAAASNLSDSEIEILKNQVSGKASAQPAAPKTAP